MANILKTGKTYTDRRKQEYDNAYMVIDDFLGFQLPDPRLEFTVKIWKDKATKDAYTGDPLASPPVAPNRTLIPVYEKKISMNSTDLFTYLSSPVSTPNATEIPKDFILTQLYKFLGTELPDIQGVTWSDWKSDVVGGVPQIIPNKKRRR